MGTGVEAAPTRFSRTVFARDSLSRLSRILELAREVWFHTKIVLKKTFNCENPVSQMNCS